MPALVGLVLVLKWYRERRGWGVSQLLELADQQIEQYLNAQEQLPHR